MLAACVLAASTLGCGAGGDTAGAARPGHEASHPAALPPLPPGVVPRVCAATWGHLDGDGFRCATAGQVQVVRVAAIDAPEVGQAFAVEARRRLETLTPPGTVIACHARDRHERHLCRVFDPQGRPVAPVMLAEGLAWHAVRFADEQTATERATKARLADEARAARRGLWSRPDPMPPWVCRERRAAGDDCR